MVWMLLESFSTKFHNNFYLDHDFRSMEMRSKNHPGAKIYLFIENSLETLKRIMETYEWDWTQEFNIVNSLNFRFWSHWKQKMLFSMMTLPSNFKNCHRRKVTDMTVTVFLLGCLQRIVSGESKPKIFKNQWHQKYTIFIEHHPWINVQGGFRVEIW